MKKPDIPKNEQERLDALRKYKVLDTEAEDIFQNIVKTVARVCDTEIALISLVDEDRQWFKAKYGLNADETGRDISFCGHAINQKEVFIVEDAKNDERFKDNPLCLDAPDISFYAGMPLVCPEGHCLGTLCAIDSKKKKLDQSQIEVLKNLADHVVDLFELRLSRLVKEEDLKESNKYLDFALEGANLGIWDWYLEDNSVKFDRRWAEMLGLDHSKIDMELKTWESKVHPEDLADCYKDIQAYMNGETDQYQNIHRMKHTNGEWVYIFDQGKFSDWNEEGKPIRFTGTHLDITRRKRRDLIQEAISETRRNYIEHTNSPQKFFNFLLEKIIAVTGSEYGFIGQIIQGEEQRYLKTFAITDISWNEETSKFYNDNVEKGLEFKNLETLFGSVIKNEKIIMTNDPKVHPDASGIPKGHPPLNSFFGIPIFHLSEMIAMVGIANREQGYTESLKEELTPLIDSVGEIISHFLIDQKTIEGDFERKIIYENSGIGIWKMNIADQSLVWDQSMYDLYGITEDSFEGHYDAWTKSIHPDDMERATSEFEAAVEGTGNFDTNFRIVAGNGEVRHIRARATVLRDIAKNALKVIGVNWDVTDEYLMRKDLDSQRKIAENKARLASLGELAAGVGHEINNPLAVISGYVSFVEKKLNATASDIKEDIGEKLDKIRSSIERISKIVRGLKTFSRSGDETHRHFDLIDVYNESIEMIENIYIQDDIKFIANNDIALGEAMMKGDRYRISQILINLLTNAKDAVEGKKDPRVEIGVELLEDNFTFVIRDNGPGISKDIENKIFDPFFTTKELNKGTGIGLSLVHGIVLEHQGKISFNNLSEGCEFRVTFKLSEKVDKKESKESLECYSDDYSGLKVLVVDDEEEITEILDDIFTELGFKVDVTSNGKKAYDKVVENPEKYDLVVSDIKMPVMDGVSLLRELQENNSIKQPKYLLVSGIVDTDEKVKKEIDRLADAYLAKPFNESGLRKVLKKLF